MERKKPAQKERSNRDDRNTTGGQGGPRRSGEGSASALANLRKIERERARSNPDDDANTRR
ncbi:MAG TPA: hypothetical protein VKD22_14055 [Ramlibacter sp.]|nr:hypothetical protein [Ramlibacter sp.]